MLETDPQQIALHWRAGRPVPMFVVLAAGLLAALAMVSFKVLGMPLIPVICFVVIVIFSLRGMVLSYPHETLGWCNAVTLTRAAMVAFLAGAVWGLTLSGWLVFGVASLAFAMDGLDGWLARRDGMSSAFGARFDMEIDAALGAVLAVGLLNQGNVGPEILVLGFMRYVFVFASLFVPALNGELPDRFRRKAVCVVQIGALIVLLCPLTPVTFLMPISMIAAALLVWSFAVDTIWLLRKTA